MSEERAAAHIQGGYMILCVLIGALLGGGGVRALWLKQEAENQASPEPSSSANVAPDNKRPPISMQLSGGEPIAPLKSSVVQASADEPIKPKPLPPPPPPVPIRRTFFEYDSLVDGDIGSPIDRLRAVDSFNGKTVDWVGYFGELNSINDDSRDAYFTISVRSGSRGDWGAWCYMPRVNEGVVRSLKINQPIRIRGVLKSKSSVFGGSIETVPTSSVTIEDYLQKLRSNAPLLEVSRQYVGKHVEWSATVESLQTYPNGRDRKYRITLVPVKDGPSLGYIYCYLSSEVESSLEDLSKGVKVKVAGILANENDLQLTTLSKSYSK